MENLKTFRIFEKTKLRNQPNNTKTSIVHNLKNKIMVKFQKVLLIIGCIAALLSGVISVINDKFDAYAFISALLFFNLYLNVMTIEKLEKK